MAMSIICPPEGPLDTRTVEPDSTQQATEYGDDCCAALESLGLDRIFQGSKFYLAECCLSGVAD